MWRESLKELQGNELEMCFASCMMGVILSHQTSNLIALNNNTLFCKSGPPEKKMGIKASNTAEVCYVIFMNECECFITRVSNTLRR